MRDDLSGLLRILAAVVVVALVPVVGAAAAPGGRTVRTYAGITCLWLASTHYGSVACQRADGAGLVGVVSHPFVAVRTAKGRIVLFKNQPTQSRGFGPVKDKRIFHSETHRGIACYWTRTGGGVALCNRADKHGYVIGVGRRLVMPLNEASKVVFVRNQR